MNPVAARAAVGFALQIPALLLAARGGPLMVFGVGFALMALLSARVGQRWEIPPLPKGLLQLLLAGAVVAFASGFIGRVQVRGANGAFGAYILVSFLALAVPRGFFKTDRMGQTITLGLGLLALLGASRSATRTSFALAVALYLFAGVIATLARDPSAPRLFKHGRRAAGPLSAAFTLMLLVMAGFAWLLPVAEPVVSKAVGDYMDSAESGTSGFSEGSIKLGSLREITTSDTVVMRVFGDADYLRGQVHVTYQVGRWAQAAVAAHESYIRKGVLNLGAGPKSEVEITIEADSDAGRAYFAPLEAMTLKDLHPEAELDKFGVVRAPNEVLNSDRRWRMSVGDPHRRHIAPPGDADRALPRWLRQEITQKAQDWTAGASTPADKIEALVRQLGQFKYSLELDQTPNGVDPVLYFLNTAQRGHCEYFASAMALLARGVGIPARLVTGYRVFELSPIGGYHIVRMRDAHAWVELWIGGHWQTVDPTPPGALAGEGVPTASWLGARWDLLRRALGQAFEALAALTLGRILAIAVVLISLGLLVIWLRRRTKKTRPPLRHCAPLTRLEAHLAKTQPPRAPGEPLTQYAQRLRAVGLDDAAVLVEACAELLYGQRGAEPQISQAVTAFLKTAKTGEPAQ